MRGRKPKNYTFQEKELQKVKRVFQNRINKRNQRIRDKGKMNLPPNLTEEQKREEYIYNLIQYFSEMEFDIHFTGTFEPKHTKKISLQSLKSYTDKFIQVLIDEDLIEYGLVFLDTGENDNNHTHIVIKSRQNIKNFQSLLKSKWFLGNNVNVNVIKTEQHKFHTIRYGFKKMGYLRKYKGQKLELWNFIKK